MDVHEHQGGNGEDGAQAAAPKTQEELKELFQKTFEELVAQGMDPTLAAAQAIQVLGNTAAETNAGAKSQDEAKQEQRAPGVDNSSKAEQESAVIASASSSSSSAGAAGAVAAACGIAAATGTVAFASTLAPSARSANGENVEMMDAEAKDGGNASTASSISSASSVDTPPRASEDAGSAMEIVAPATADAPAAMEAPAPAPPVGIPPDEPIRGPVFSLDELQDMVAKIEQDGVRPIIRRIGAVFSDPAHLVVSFGKDGAPDVPDVDKARAVFDLLESIDDEGVDNSLRNAFSNLSAQMNFPFTNFPQKRVIPLVVCLEYGPFQYDPDLVKVMQALFQTMVHAPEETRDHLRELWMRAPFEYLQRMLGTIQMYITLQVLQVHRAIANFGLVQEGVVLLDLLHQVNCMRGFTEYVEFYNSSVNEIATESDSFLGEDLVTWFKNRHDQDGALLATPGPKLSFCDFPFMLDPGSKARVLQMEARLQQQLQQRVVPLRGRMMQFFLVRVRRASLVDDVLDIVAQSGQEDFKKPLRVQFEGEEGVDEGGVQKEFFLLMVRQLLDPSFGMFQMDEDSRLLWFNPNTFEGTLKFELVGILLGIAIYNGVILDLSFPKAMYKKLLEEAPTMEDLEQLSPQLAKGLKDLLEFDGDVEATFCRNFQLSYEVFGEVKTVDLKEGGADIPVTAENRQEYVNLYLAYHFDRSVAKFFDAFHRGFHMVCGGAVLDWFEPEELELLICGSAKLDFDELESGCIYEGYTAESDVIKNFWSVLKELSDEQKKQFLQFTTGSDRVPIRGLKSLRLVIQKNGTDTDMLPTAHTCFNHFILPPYTTREKLKDKLTRCLEYNSGFGNL